MPLEESMIYLADSSIVIWNDARIRHMVIAVNTSTLRIFFATMPYRYWLDTKKYKAIFYADAESPEVEKVLLALKTLI